MDRTRTTDADPHSAASTQAFYGRWASLYDRIARHTPGVAAVRRLAADACRLEAGDTVVELGCGTGANLGYLRDAVGPTGTVVGVDITRPVLERALEHVGHYGNVHLVRGDATRPPFSSGSMDDVETGGPVDRDVDAVLATFVAGMLPDPAAAVDDWCDLVGPGGYVVLANAGRSRGRLAPIVDPVFDAIVRFSTPPTTKLRYTVNPTDVLDAKVAAAHDRLVENAAAIAEARAIWGTVRITGGRVAADRG